MFWSIISLCSTSEQLHCASLNQTWRLFVIVFPRGWQKGECFVEGLWIKIILCTHQWHHSSITNEKQDDFLCYLHSWLVDSFSHLSWNYKIIQFKCRCSACILRRGCVLCVMSWICKREREHPSSLLRWLRNQYENDHEKLKLPLKCILLNEFAPKWASAWTFFKSA